MTIFRIAHFLERFGHDVQLLIQNPTIHTSAEAARETINKHFQPFSGAITLFGGVTPDSEGDALIATDRFTCYPARAMGKFVRKFYFVQDYEPSFYPMGSEALLTEATYRFDFDCLCAGEWLRKIMCNRFGNWAMSWPLAYDESVYNSPYSSDRSNSRIAVYARHVTSRRAVELAFIALEILKARDVKFEVDFFGWELGSLKVDFPYRDHGVLTPRALASLYRNATLGMVFSATNHSLVNKEMMACGLPVIDLDLDTVTTIFPPGTIALTQPTPEAIADTIEQLLARPNERDRLRNSGVSYIEGLSWEKSARMIEGAICSRVLQYVNEGSR
ncbi:glycosyltransferase involved in cell wall biosynthesis [Neorhizobium sp. 2083]|uniref:glycosyltransferase family protein n=1 Tax=Neorhizobium sp. 2083 TaxID=2817762 RepID=UPI002857BC63|nr:glycosyltransferase [Neorhizobium sp. 2083]MDR6816448.1 glycosyltransferase involved in cell wall biosynthesis [Neorhizobium sp. 2083]